MRPSMILRSPPRQVRLRAMTLSACEYAAGGSSCMSRWTACVGSPADRMRPMAR
jgi:hypothetical protein